MPIKKIETREFPTTKIYTNSDDLYVVAGWFSNQTIIHEYEGNPYELIGTPTEPLTHKELLDIKFDIEAAIVAAVLGKLLKNGDVVFYDHTAAMEDYSEEPPHLMGGTFKDGQLDTERRNQLYTNERNTKIDKSLFTEPPSGSENDSGDSGEGDQ